MAVVLTPAERRELLEAWPWPEEAATTKGGFSDVVAAVESIIERRTETPTIHSVPLTAEAQQQRAQRLADHARRASER